MSIDMSQFYEVFFEETAEHLATMESLLLELDVDSPDLEDLNAIFRAAHSIKGGSGTFGFNDMTEVTHILETLLDKLRKQELPVRTVMVDAFLQACDVLKGQLAGHRGESTPDSAAAASVCAELTRLASEGNLSTGTAQTATTPPHVTESSHHLITTDGEHCWQISFEFARDLVSTDTLQNLFDTLASLGKLDYLQRPATEDNRQAWRLQLTTTAPLNEIRELCIFVLPEDNLVISASNSDDHEGHYGFFETSTNDDIPANSLTAAHALAPVHEEEGFGFFAPLPTAASDLAEDGYGFFAPLPDMATAGAPTTAPVATSTAPAIAPPPNKPSTQAAAAHKNANADNASIRVSVEKVDQMINLVGELVITQAMLIQTASIFDPVQFEQLHNGLLQLERNTRDLQESVMSIRMMPIGFIFSRFPRVVRDLAGKLGKQVQLVTVGEGTEMDKGLIEKLADPLTHLVRNSLDHGIELPEKRQAVGKNPKGTVTLRAYHQGGSIIIEINDDGAGLNREKILAKAKERGLAINENMSDQDVWLLIFEPGFSTAEQVTDVSGRGVGMDVVKRNILGMGGKIVLDSVFGVGTQITIRLPLTLAILDGMSVAVGQEIFIIPLTFIVESLQPKKEDLRTIQSKGRVVRVRGEYLPLLLLHELFHIETHVSTPEHGIVVIVEANGSKVALALDSLLGQHQVVIKSLETNYRKVPGMSGATIMGDGRVALILDISALVHMSQQA